MMALSSGLGVLMISMVKSSQGGGKEEKGEKLGENWEITLEG